MKLTHLALAAAFALVASRGDARQEQFANAVGELAQRAIAQQATPLDPLIDRMAAALTEWDRSIQTLESRIATELPGASDRRAFQLHVELGLAYRQRGRLGDAIREFDAAAAANRTASDVHVLRGLTLDAAGRSDDAATAFQNAWSLDRQNPVKAYYVLLYPSGTETQRARQALTAAYERSLTGAPGRKSAPFLMLDAIGDSFSRAPVVADAATADAFTLLAAGKYSEAVSVLRRAAGGENGRSDSSRETESPVAHFARARRDEAAGRIPEARRAYQSAIAGTLAGRSLLYIGIGRLAQVEGDVAGAIDAFRFAVRLNPNDAIAHRELAGALAAEGRIDDAFAELVAALLIDPSDASALATIGQLFLDSGRFADAVPPLTRTLQLAPDRFETHYALATAWTHLGKTAEAARERERFERARQQMVEKRRRDIDSIPPGGER